MKTWKKLLAIALVLSLILSMAVSASAATNSGMDDLPAGTYVYVDTKPKATEDTGQVQFDFAKREIIWAYDNRNGTVKLTGDELEFFQSLYLSDRPAYDWLASAPRETEGIAGAVSNNLQISITEEGKISGLSLISEAVQMTAVVSKEITDDTMTVSGTTRGQPNLLHSCLTLIGSTNCLYITGHGNVVLDNMSIGHNKEGVGLKADKIGADTFITGTVVVDGVIEWYNRYANIQPVTADHIATLMTNGQDIYMGGMNIGRVGRNLTISTGEDKGGDIIIGEHVTVDYGRGAPLKDPSTGTLILSTSGDLIAGKGDVIIGTNTERVVKVDTIGNIQGANVIIKPTNNGKIMDITGSIGSINATESIEIQVGSVNAGNFDTPAIGSLTAQNGDITVVAGQVDGTVGSITAAKGSVDLTMESIGGIGTVTSADVRKNIGEVNPGTQIIGTPMTSTVVVDGKTIGFDAYTIDGNNYFKLHDIAYVLSGTTKQFSLSWYGTEDAFITMNSNSPYTPIGGELTAGNAGEKVATPVNTVPYIDMQRVTFTGYKIDNVIYFKLRDMAKVFNFGVEWSGATNSIIIDTTKGY